MEILYKMFKVCQQHDVSRKKKLKMMKRQNDTRYNIMFHILILSFILTVNGLCTLNDDSMLYNETLFLGTHNSAINLGPHTPFRPASAETGKYISSAHQSYGYQVMDQRLSVLDQLEQGIRFLDFEVAQLKNDWICSKETYKTTSTCTEHITLKGRCFSNCPFIVSHGTVEESIGAGFGYTFPNPLFTTIATFVKKNPNEIITILLLATHGNSFPNETSLAERLKSTGLLPHIYNFDTNGIQFDLNNTYPTLGEMRAANKTIMVISGSNHHRLNYSPSFAIAYANASGLQHKKQDADTCIDAITKMPIQCLEYWDSITKTNLLPENIVLDQSYSDTDRLFMVPMLSSRRGRSNTDLSYTNLPNLLKDFPYMAGGNPQQANAVNDASTMVTLVNRWDELFALSKMNKMTSFLLVDFFNTTTPDPTKSSRTLLPQRLTSMNESLVNGVCEINRKRTEKKK